MKTIGIGVGAFALAVAAHAADVTFTGTNGAPWSVGANWSGGIAPAGGDNVQIDSGDAVNWDFGSGWHSPGNPAEVNLDGTLTSVGAVRSWATVWNIGATGSLDLDGGWLVPGGGGTEWNFTSGAILNQTSGRLQLSANADITLGFNLDAAGFNTITGNLLQVDGYVGQTIKADMAGYTGGTNTVVLMDFAGNNGVTETDFEDFNLSVTNTGSFTNSYLRWNETDSAIELVIADVLPEPPAPPSYENYVWENDMSVDPVGNGWVDRNGSSDYTVGGGLLSMNEGVFTTVLDTTGFTNFWKGITKIDMEWRSTSTAPGINGLGAGLWVNVDTDAPDYGAIHFDAVLETNDTQTVKIFQGFDTLLLTLPGFSTNMLTLHAEIKAFDYSLTYEITDGVLTNSGSLGYGDLTNTGEPGLGTLFTGGPSAEFDYVKVDVNAFPDEGFVTASPETLNLQVNVPETVATGLVALTYGSVTNIEVSAAISDESHPGSFSVLSATPQTLDPVGVGSIDLVFEYDNTVSNLPVNSSSTGLVTITWSEAGSGVFIDILVPISASVVQLSVWDNGGSGQSFETAENWVGDVAPVSGNSSVLFDSSVSQDDCYINSAFSIGANQSMRCDGNIVMRFGTGAHLTVQAGGILDFRSEGFGVIAENQNVPVNFTFESGAIAKAHQIFMQSSWTNTFVADASGVTIYDIGGLWTRESSLVVDVSSYDPVNGTDIVLFDYQSLNGTFSNVTVVGGSGTVDYAYDQGGGDLAIALSLDVEPYDEWALGYGLAGLNGDQPDDINNAEGIDNLSCYGWGLDPTTGAPADGALPQIGSDAAGLVYVVAQRNDDPSLNFSLLTRDNLVIGDWKTNNTPADYTVGGTLTVGSFDYVTNVIDTTGDATFIEPVVNR